MPKNDEGPSTSYIDPATLTSTFEIETPTIPTILDIKLIIQEDGCGIYKLPNNAFVIGELPQSPRSRGRPQENQAPSSQTYLQNYPEFTRWGDLGHEVIEADPSNMLYRDERPTPELPMDERSRGLHMMLAMGYA